MNKETEIERRTCPQIQEELFDEACEFVSRITSNPPGEEGTEEIMRAWAGQSADHQQALDDALEVWNMAGELDPNMIPKWEDIDDEASDQPNHLFSAAMRHFDDAHLGGRNFLMMAASAAMIIGATFLIIQLSSFGARETTGLAELNVANAQYTTDQSQHHFITLPDGSKITLGGRSRARAGYTGSVRRVYLDDGEALFTVNSDDPRPFTVVVDGFNVTAIGTEFNIRRNDQSALVSVIEGIVVAAGRTESALIPTEGEQQQNAVELRAGQAVLYTKGVGLNKPSDRDPAIATSWLTGQLIYRGESLQNVITDVNRYYDRVIIPADQKVSALKYTGTVATDNVDEWLSAVENAFGINAVEQSEGIVRLEYERM